MTHVTLRAQPSAPPTDDAPLHAPDSGNRPRSRVPLMIAGVAFGALLAAATMAYRGLPQPPATAELRITGLISANEVTVAARTAGRIMRLTVAEGDEVAAGSTVATLDRDELDAAHRQQLAVIAELTARLGRSQEIVALESRRAEGQIARARAELNAAESRRQQAYAELLDAREEAARTSALVERQLVPRRELDRLDAQAAVAEARDKAAQDDIAAMTAGLSLAETAARQVGLAARDVEQIRAQQQQAEAQLAQVEAKLDATVLLAPIGGVVSLRVAREGEVVNAGDPVVVLLDPDDVWIRAAVEESLVGDLTLGDAVQVELLSGDRVTGRVSFIAPEAGFATQRDVSRARRDVRTFGIKVALPDADRRLHAGMTAFVLLPQGTRAARR